MVRCDAAPAIDSAAFNKLPPRAKIVPMEGVRIICRKIAPDGVHYDSIKLRHYVYEIESIKLT